MASFFPDSDYLASDEDRAYAADLLGEAFTHGRLTISEFEERSAAIGQARTYRQLNAQLHDLPDGFIQAQVSSLPSSPSMVPGVVPNGSLPNVPKVDGAPMLFRSLGFIGSILASICVVGVVAGAVAAAVPTIIVAVLALVLNVYLANSLFSASGQQKRIIKAQSKMMELQRAEFARRQEEQRRIERMQRKAITREKTNAIKDEAMDLAQGTLRIINNQMNKRR